MPIPDTKAERGNVPPEIAADAARLAEGLASEPKVDLDGLEVAFPGEAPDDPQPPKEDYEERLREAEKRADTAEKRFQDTQRSWNEDHMARLEAERKTAALEEDRRRAELAAEQARQMAPPEFDEDDFHDPAVMKQKLNELKEWTRQQTLATVAHPINAMTAAVGKVDAMSEVHADMAWDRAASELAELGLDPADFHSKKDEILNGFRAMGEDGAQLRLIPQRLTGAYMLLKADKKEPFVKPASGGKPPVTTTARSPRGGEAARSLENRIQAVKGYYGANQMRQMLANLGLEGTVNLTEDELVILERGMQR